MIETRTFLELTRPEDLRPCDGPDGKFELKRIDPPDPVLGRALYATVGERWQWVDRLAWSPTDWTRHYSSPRVTLWVLYDQDRPAGYFELVASEDDAVEIAYFGMVPEFVGRRLGGYVLTAAVREAFALGAGRVWLHTCTRDHPHALPNYKARGFRVVRTEPL